jgi:lipoprotein
MKHFYTKTLLILVALFACENIAKAQNTNSIIAFLKETPKTAKTNCSSEDLTNLLTDDSKQWVESIECQNINLDNIKSGVQMAVNIGSEFPSSITINFNKKKALQPLSLFIYANDCDNNESPMWISINDTEAQSNKVGFNVKSYINNCAAIIDAMNFKSGSIDVPNVPMTGLNQIPLKSCKIEIKPDNRSRKIQLYGIRVYHNNNPIDISDISVAVEGIEAEPGIKVCEYYDLMGRRLPEEPQSGIYVRKCGEKIEKLIANGK